MKITLFYHSLYSDWNHGNAHFLRGIVTELIKRGHSVEVYEPVNGWSLNNLIRDHGKKPLDEFKKYYPGLSSVFYSPGSADQRRMLKDTDVVIAHEWNDSALINQLGEVKKALGYLLYFHDTHHRIISKPDEINKLNLEEYDGILAFGQIIKTMYRREKRVKNAWTWHEAADARVFHPIKKEKEGDLVWVGNWGDNERTEELHEFLINPVKKLKLKAKVFGVRYPEKAIEALNNAGIEYGGWLPNYKVPEVFAAYRVTVHVPRSPYVELLPGIPTIRPFEAMACGIPLICSPWDDNEKLFTEGNDYLMAHNGDEMVQKLQFLLSHDQEAAKLSQHALKTILSKHTCAHRVDQLENILRESGLPEEKLNPLYQQA